MTTTEFDEFVLGHGRSLLQLGYLLSGDHALAQDLVQQALVKAYPRWGRQIEHPAGYVRRIVVNEFITWRRGRGRCEQPGRLPEVAIADRADDVARHDLVWRALADLPRRQRAVLVLRHYEQLDDREIAGVLGCAEGTVRSLASRAGATLRRRPDLRADFLGVHQEGMA